MKKLLIPSLAIALCTFAALAVTLLKIDTAQAGGTVNLSCEGTFCYARVTGGGGSSFRWSGAGGAFPAQYGTKSTMRYNCNYSTWNPRAIVNVYNASGGFIGSATQRVGCRGPF